MDGRKAEGCIGKESPVFLQITRLEKAIVRCSQVAEELEARLQAILMQGEIQAPGDKCDKRQPACQLSGSLEELGIGVDVVITKLESIVGRCAI